MPAYFLNFFISQSSLSGTYKIVTAIIFFCVAQKPRTCIKNKVKNKDLTPILFEALRLYQKYLAPIPSQLVVSVKSFFVFVKINFGISSNIIEEWIKVIYVLCHVSRPGRYAKSVGGFGIGPLEHSQGD